MNAALNKAEAAILDIVRRTPGIPGRDIFQTLVDHSRTAKWFGRASVITAFLGPSLLRMYGHIDRLEQQGLLTSSRDAGTPAHGGHRPRRYFACGDAIIPRERED